MSNPATQGTGPMRTTGNVVNKTTTMVCTASIVMKKMIFEIRMPFSAEAAPSKSGRTLRVFDRFNFEYMFLIMEKESNVSDLLIGLLLNIVKIIIYGAIAIDLIFD